MNFPQILRFPIRKRFVGPQDDFQNASRSAQDGSKTVLKSVFLDVKNNLNFCLVSGLVFHGFGRPQGTRKLLSLPPFSFLKSIFFLNVVLASLGLPKKRLRGPKSSPRPLPGAPRGAPDHPKSAQEAPRASNAQKSLKLLKTKKLFRFQPPKPIQING